MASTIGKTLKSYVFWTYPRGSFHYDVMVTLILAFIFLSPLVINYRDRPRETLNSAEGILVKHEGPNALLFEIGGDQIGAHDEPALRTELKERIESISGAIQIDRVNEQKDTRGRVVEYRVWAHR